MPNAFTYGHGAWDGRVIITRGLINILEPDELKAVLLDHKDQFIRNLTTKMLGYALGRGLTVKDSCAVDSIVAQLKDNNYSAQTLIEAIVLSVPFQYQAGSPQRRKEQQKP